MDHKRSPGTGQLKKFQKFLRFLHLIVIAIFGALKYLIFLKYEAIFTRFFSFLKCLKASLKL